jgi:hypothetical protein
LAGLILDCYNHTKNFSDLAFALFELVHHFQMELVSGPSFNTIHRLLKRRSTFPESMNNSKPNTDLHSLLCRFPAVDAHLVDQLFATFCNLEAEKLGVPGVYFDTFASSLFEFGSAKFERLSALSEVDDDYDMIINNFADQLISKFDDESLDLNEILKARIGNNISLIFQSYKEKKQLVSEIRSRSIGKAKYRGTLGDFAKLRSIISRVGIFNSPEMASALHDSATSLLFEFPLYRDVTVPLVTAMRQV